MTQYVITATKIVNYTTVVEAPSKEDATELAKELPIEKFDNNGYEFTIDYAEERQKERNPMSKKIEYDLNIFIREELDEFGHSFWDENNWFIHVYIYDEDEKVIKEFSDAIPLTIDEVNTLRLNNDGYFSSGDFWYRLEAFWLDYAPQLSDRLKDLFSSLPKYYEELENTNG